MALHDSLLGYFRCIDCRQKVLYRAIIKCQGVTGGDYWAGDTLGEELLATFDFPPIISGTGRTVFLGYPQDFDEHTLLVAALATCDDQCSCKRAPKDLHCFARIVRGRFLGLSLGAHGPSNREVLEFAIDNTADVSDGLEGAVAAARAKRHQQTWGGYSFHIDWGIPFPDPADAKLKVTIQTKGGQSYLVTAATFKFIDRTLGLSAPAAEPSPADADYAWPGYLVVRRIGRRHIARAIDELIAAGRAETVFLPI